MEDDLVFLGHGNRTKYYYDAYNRRRAKVYPTSVSDEFFYDTGHQLLEDRGNYSLTTAADYPIDEYVWLDGRPIAFVRAKFNSSWERQPDFAGSCQRNGESTPCGVYFVVTDHLAKPVLLLDSALRVAGAADYEPFGYPNRVTKVADTDHPYSADQAAVVLASFSQPRGPNALVRLRAKFHFVDTEACGTTAYDYAFLTDSSSADLGAAKIAGYKQGPGWSEWVSVPSDGQVDVRFTSNSENLCPDGNGCVTSNYCYWGWDYKGVVVEGYEYQRYESTSSPAWLALRFPGQYYDPETDLFENWNRYYDPSGRYLSPEPLLQEPQFVLARAAGGAATPTYAYASNNPIAFTDPDGLHDNNGCKNSPSCMACDALADKITDRTLRLCVRIQCKAQDLKLKCDADAKKGCATLMDEKKGIPFKKGKGASAPLGTTEEPTKTINWCEQPQSSNCQEMALVHEIAHTCGWNHTPGMGVPGENGRLPPECGSVK